MGLDRHLIHSFVHPKYNNLQEIVNKARNGRKLHNNKSQRLYAGENWQIVEITYKKLVILDSSHHF